MRKDYNAVKLTSEEKTLLNILKHAGYTQLTRDRGDYSTAETDSCKELNVRWLKGFEWIDEGDAWSIDLLLNPPHDPKTVWDLKDGDAYWWISSRGSIYKDEWENVPFTFNIGCRNQGNIFLTEEEAVFEAKRREVCAKVKKYARPFICSCPNVYPYFDTAVNNMCFGYVEYYQFATDYFESVEDIKQAIAEVGEEDFKKYYLGVTE